jgi:signal peptide peptidase SppA
MKYTNLMSYLLESVWGIVPSVLERALSFVANADLRISEVGFNPKSTINNLQSTINNPQSQNSQSIIEYGEDVLISGGVAVVKLHGSFSLRGGIDADCMRVYSYTDIERMMVRLASDARVSVVVLDIDSPGGTVSGIKEAVRGIEVYRQSGKKLLVYASGLMCSAAYWLSSYADEIYVTPSAVVGSIGVYMLHISVERHLDKEGYKVTLIEAGKYKMEGTEYRDLSAETLERYREKVEKNYEEFLGIVIKNRKLSYDERNMWAEGRVFEGEEAVRVGLVDGVMTPVEFRERVLSVYHKPKVKTMETAMEITNAGQGAVSVEVTDVAARVSFLEGELMERERVISGLKESVSLYEKRIETLESELNLLRSKHLEMRFEAMMRENASRVNAAQREKFYEMFKKSESEETLTLIEGLVSVLPDRASELVEGAQISNPAPLPVPTSVKTLEEKKAMIAELANRRVSMKKSNS